MNLGFTESIEKDSVYFDQYGFKYAIVELKLNKKLYLDWAKETQICSLIRLDKYESIKARKVVSSLEELKEIIKFFKDE